MSAEDYIPPLYQDGNGNWVLLDSDGKKYHVATKDSRLGRAMAARLAPSAVAASNGFIDARLAWITSRAKQGMNPPTRDEVAAYADGYADAAVAARLAPSSTGAPWECPLHAPDWCSCPAPKPELTGEELNRKVRQRFGDLLADDFRHAKDCAVHSPTLRPCSCCLETRMRDEIARLKSLQSATTRSSPWIPTSERMPEHGVNVLFLTAAGSWFGWRDTNTKDVDGENPDWRDHFDDGKICTDLAVTHWMPFPEMPADHRSDSKGVDRG